MAAADPDLLVIAIDANADNLRRASRRGGTNLVLGRLALERAPGALAGLAGRLTVLHPWGSLREAVAGRGAEGLGRLRGMCAPGATIEVVMGLDDLDGTRPGALAGPYAAAGFTVAVEGVGAAEVEALGTTWGRRLARSDPARRFWRVRGAAAER